MGNTTSFIPERERLIIKVDILISFLKSFRKILNESSDEECQSELFLQQTRPILGCVDTLSDNIFSFIDSRPKIQKEENCDAE